MSNNEPGALTRSIVADKNARAAVEIAKQARSETSEMRQRLVQLEAEVAAYKQLVEKLRIDSLTAFAKSTFGTGPTANGDNN